VIVGNADANVELVTELAVGNETAAASSLVAMAESFSNTVRV
jgi:hypothetical protein